MKHIIVLVDGMADLPLEVLNGKTPMEAALTPTLDKLAPYSELGLVNTVPSGMAPGSDVANLSLMGYDLLVYHTGRSPLEAASIGVTLSESDVALRCNLITLNDGSGKYGHYNHLTDCVLEDYSAGEISTEEARLLIEALAADLNTSELKLYTGVSYRHLLVWSHGHTHDRLVPPHDIQGLNTCPHWPSSALFDAFQQRAHHILAKHPVNVARIARGQRPANGVWLWGAGRKPALEPFYNLYGLKGHVISAVDLIKGIGILAGMRIIDVEGATGTLHTNFLGKGKAALKALLEGDDFSYIHLEAPDECGHQGDVQGKITALERIDEQVIAPLIAGLEEAHEDFRLLVVPDHPTPIQIRTHTAKPVPYLLYDSRRNAKNSSLHCIGQGDWRFTEYFGAYGAQKKARWQASGPHLLMRLAYSESVMSNSCLKALPK